MKVLVPIKRVVDPYVKIRVKSDGSGVETNNVKMTINPFDEIAVEQAVRMKEKGEAQEIVIVSIGDKSIQESIRAALALGADRGLHIQTSSILEPINIAKILHHVAVEQACNMVLMGKQTIDGDHNQTGQMLAALLAWPQATFASEIILEQESVLVTREIDGGLETIKLDLPAVITTDLRLNEPRYASLPNIMKAKRKPIEERALEDLQLSLKQHIEVLETRTPQQREAGIRVADVKTLVDKLRHEAKVL